MISQNKQPRPAIHSGNNQPSNPQRWPKRRESRFTDATTATSGTLTQKAGIRPSKSGNRTHLKCNLASKAGHTSNGGLRGGVDVNAGEVKLYPAAFPSTHSPFICSGNKVLKPPKEAIHSIFLWMPIFAFDLYATLRSIGVNPHYKTFVQVCIYIHCQWQKTKDQQLGGFFETSGQEAKCFVKELSVNGHNTALPKILDDIELTRKKPGYIISEQAIRREFVGNSRDRFELLPCNLEWVESIERKLRQLFDSYLERRELVHIKNSYDSLSFLDSDLEEIANRYTKSKESGEWGCHYAAYAESVLSGEPWQFSPNGNRVYAYARNFPSDFRIRGFFDYKGSGERVCLVDLKSSHPTMLAKVLRDYLSKRRNGPESVENALLELDEYSSLIHSGKLYESIQGPEKRKDSKFKFQKWLNGEGWHYQEVNDWFQRLFPELFCIIRSFKNRESFTALHSHFRRIEAAAIMQAVKFCHDRSIPAVPIIDEIMVPESEGEKVALQLLSLLNQQFSLKAVVSVDYHDSNAEDFAREKVFR